MSPADRATPLAPHPGVCPVCDFIGGHAADCEQLAYRGTTRAAELAKERERNAAGVSPDRVTHLRKADPDEFEAFLDGSRTFFVTRAHGEAPKLGDAVRIREFVATSRDAGTLRGHYTGREFVAAVTHVVERALGIRRGWAALSLALEEVNGKRWERQGGPRAAAVAAAAMARRARA